MSEREAKGGQAAASETLDLVDLRTMLSWAKTLSFRQQVNALSPFLGRHVFRSDNKLQSRSLFHLRSRLRFKSPIILGPLLLRQSQPGPGTMIWYLCMTVWIQLVVNLCVFVILTNISKLPTWIPRRFSIFRRPKAETSRSIGSLANPPTHLGGCFKISTPNGPIWGCLPLSEVTNHKSNTSVSSPPSEVQLLKTFFNSSIIGISLESGSFLMEYLSKFAANSTV